MAGKSFIASQRADHTHVERTALLGEIDAELARCGIVVLCAPWGYGKTDVLRDYGRIAHARMPLRPWLRIDYGLPEVQAYLHGTVRPVERLISREARSALWLREASSAACDEDAAQMGEDLPNERVRSVDCRSSPAARLLSLYAAVLAPSWHARFEVGARCGDVPFRAMPLVTIDNMPVLDEQQVEEFADVLRAWAHEGARVIVACTPSTRPPAELLPEAFVLGTDMLEVAPPELGLWERDLHLPAVGGIEAVTGRVPLLVDTCRVLGEADPEADPVFLRAADRVMERCLDEPMCASAENARWTMVLLGRGRLEDLAVVGAALREDELAILASAYPFFGIDAEHGGFSCVPLPTERGCRALERAAAANEALAERCVCLLVAHGRLERAGAVASLLSNGARLRVYGRFPDAFADAANDGAVARSVRALGAAGGADTALQPGLARLARMHALAHDLPVRLLPEAAYRYGAGTSTGALRALRVVLGYWKGFGGLRDGAAVEEEGLLGIPAPSTEGGGEDELERLLGAAEGDVPFGGAAGGEGVYDIDAVVSSLGGAGLQGDRRLYREQLRRICQLVPFDRGGLAAAVYAAHAAVCGFLCGEAETVFSWIEPLAAQVSCAREGSGRLATVSDALLSATAACARFFVEKPSALATAAATLATLRQARAFFEERDIAPGTAVVGALEAVCLVLGGFEKQAETVLRACQARWSAQGTMVGQLLVNLGLSSVRLAQEAVNQAAVHAQTAEVLSQRLGLRRGVWLARLCGTVAAVRSGRGPDLDRRLLEATLRQSSLYPVVSVSLNVELGLLCAASGDGVRACEIFQSAQLFGRPGACRLLVAAVRAMGCDRACVLDLLPYGLRCEYESLGPFGTLRVADGNGVSAGFLSTPDPGKGLAVSLFGAFQVTVNGHVVGDGDWGRRKARLLLAFLALSPEAPAERGYLIEALWGVRPTPLARNNLNTAVSSLRATLGQKDGGCDYIVSADGALGLNPLLVDTDVGRFERLARTVLSRRPDADRGEVRHACGVLEHLYQEGVAAEIKGCARAVQERAQELDALFVDCMLVGADLAFEDGDARLALWFARAARRGGTANPKVEQAYERALAALEQRGLSDAPGEPAHAAHAATEPSAVQALVPA